MIINDPCLFLLHHKWPTIDVAFWKFKHGFVMTYHESDSSNIVLCLGNLIVFYCRCVVEHYMINKK